MTSRRILLWDVMGTLVTEPFYYAIPAFFNTTLEALLKEKHPSSWVDFEKGHIDEEAYLSLFFADERPIDGQGLKQTLYDAYEWLEGTETLLQTLKQAGFHMFALSNYPVWYQMIEEKLRLSRYLSWDFVSCKTGHRKPDERAYLTAIESLNVDPQDCLFIDDRPVNVDAARSLGMAAILRTPDINELRVSLEQAGVSVPPPSAG